MHTILGAGGVIARELTHALASAGQPVRQVGRRPSAVLPTDTCVAADLLDAAATERAVAGSEVAYLVAGLPYDAAVWEAQWPVVMRNAIDACARHGVRLVFFDNVYAYGRVDGEMTEATPFNPCSRKGEVRARIATTLLEAMQAGEVTALIARAADFYGPDARLSFTHETVVERLRARKAPQWLGNPRCAHTFTYTPDAGRATARLGLAPEAFGQTWHLTTHPEPITGEGFVRLACDLARQPYRLQAAPRWMVRLMGLVNAPMREVVETMYQMEHDYRFSSAKMDAAFGLSATPYRDGLAATLAAAGVARSEAGSEA